jgi:hypothetical protein
MGDVAKRVAIYHARYTSQKIDPVLTFETGYSDFG